MASATQSDVVFAPDVWTINDRPKYARSLQGAPLVVAYLLAFDKQRFPRWSEMGHALARFATSGALPDSGTLDDINKALREYRDELCKAREAKSAKRLGAMRLTIETAPTALAAADAGINLVREARAAVKASAKELAAAGAPADADTAAAGTPFTPPGTLGRRKRTWSLTEHRALMDRLRDTLALHAGTRPGPAKKAKKGKANPAEDADKSANESSTSDDSQESSEQEGDQEQLLPPAFLRALKSTVDAAVATVARPVKRLARDVRALSNKVEVLASTQNAQGLALEAQGGLLQSFAANPQGDSDTELEPEPSDEEGEEGELQDAPPQGEPFPVTAPTTPHPQPQPHGTAPASLLGAAKASFPKLNVKGDVDAFFGAATRYFELCGVHPSIWVKYTLAHVHTYADWWDAHCETLPEHLKSDWLYFQSVMRGFALTADKPTAARGKLLHISQGSTSLPAYNQSFMQLVRDSRTPPTDPLLITLYLDGLADRSLRRSVALHNGRPWMDVTQLIQHVSTITALERSANLAPRPPHPAAGGRGIPKQGAFGAKPQAALRAAAPRPFKREHGKPQQKTLNAAWTQPAAKPKAGKRGGHRGRGGKAAPKGDATAVLNAIRDIMGGNNA